MAAATISPAERVALEKASQYAGSQTDWTPENAPQYGLDPEKGFIARGTPIAPSQPPPPAAQASPLPEPTPSKPEAKPDAGPATVPVGAPPQLGGPIPGSGPEPSFPLKPWKQWTPLEAGDKKPASAAQPPAKVWTPADAGEKPVVQAQQPGPEKLWTPADAGEKPVQPQQGQPPSQQPAQTMPPAEQAALQQAGQYAGGPTVRVPENAPSPAIAPAPQLAPPADQDTGQKPQPEQPKEPQQQAPKPIDTLKADEQHRVDPVALYSYLLGKFANSGLVGYVPPDGARWGIKTGSAAEWAAFGLAVAKQESDLNARSWNPNDPGGSAGLFQFGQGQKPYVQGDQFDPQQSADAFVRAVQHFLANKGRIANLGVTFGSILRPNEAGQYIAGAQRVAAGGTGKDLVSSGTGDGGTGFGGGPGGGLAQIPSSGGSPPPPEEAQANPPRGGGGAADYGQGTYQGGTPRDRSFGWPSSLWATRARPEEEEAAKPTRTLAKIAEESPTEDITGPLMKQANVLGVTTVGGLPPAPGAPARLPAPSAQAQPAPVVTPKMLSPQQLMPSRYTKTPPPAAPSKPGQPKALPPPAPSATLGTGTISQAQRLPQAKQPPPPPPQQQPPAQFEAASHNMRPLGYRAAVRLTNGEVFSGPEHAHALDNAAENGSIRVSDKTTQFGFVDKDKNFISMEDADRLLEKNWYKERGLTPPQPAKEPTPFEGQRPGSTFAVPNPPGSEAIAKWPRLVDQAKQHAAILSPDDPRVKKQADGKIKGEHFVGGDPFHEQLLSGLPYGKTGRQGQILAQAEQAIGEKQPMHISYISSPAEAALHPTRESRTVQYEKHSPEARLMGTTEGQLVGHSLIPVSVGVTPAKKAGEPHESVIDGISTNVLANNFHHLNRKLAEMGRTTPYAQMDAKFTNALEGYLSNLNAGHAGTGRGHAVGTAEYPNEPDENHVPHYLTRLEADFINAAINNTAAFAKHEDGQALRRLAEANGTLITPAGETNRLLHEIEQHDPGWSGRGSGKRGRVLEPSIRTFKTGLIHEVHPSEEHMPATIRPGKEYQDLTKAIQRTSERGRPDVPVAISPRSQPIAAVPRDLAHNQLINRIEREFSEDRINEAEARQRLHAIGENPDEYRFVGGSGGLITPYEEDPEAITHEEHTQMKNNLRQQWVNGKMDVENYRQKVAEVPLPTKPSKPAAAAPPVTAPEEKPETPQTPAPAPKPLSPTPKPKPAPKAPPGPVAEPEEAPEEPAPAKAKPPAVDEPLPTPVKTPLEEAAPVKAKGPPAPDEPLPAPRAPEKPKETTEIQKKPGTEPIPEPLPAKPAAPPVEDTQQQKRIARKAEKAQEEEEEKLKEEVMRQAAADRDDISPEDQAGMNRLNKKAKTVAKQLGEIDPLSMHAHLTGQRTFPGKLKNEQIGEYYDANNPRLDYGKEEHRERVSHAVFHDIVHSLAGTTTGGKPSTAYGWYNRTVQKSLKKTAEVAPKILTDPAHALAWKLAWAITSQGQDVFPNTESTWAAYRHFHEHGRLPESRAIFGGGVKAEQMEENFKKINKLWHGDENQKGLGHEALQKRLMKRMTVGDLEKKFGMKVPGELKHHIVNGAMFMGAKIGSFFSNLNGDFDPTTMDLWFSRNMNLMAGNMFNFSDEATRKDRIEKGKVVKSHLNQLKEVLDSGMLSSVDPDKARKMSEELSALMAHPEGQLDRPTARALAPEIYDWARKQHNFYQQSPGLEGSYNKALKTPENTAAKKLDLGVSELSNAPRNGTEREQWRDIMRRAGDKLKAVGLKLVNADKQALLWFVIKDLFRMGGSPQRDKADYLDASHMLVHKVKTGKLPGLPVEQLEKAA